jgi:predicted nucleic acid-binding protein
MPCAAHAIARILDQVDAWLEAPTPAWLAQSAAHRPALHELSSEGGVAGARVHDARLAALCRHGVRELWSADRDVSRLVGLLMTNPLVGPRST